MDERVELRLLDALSTAHRRLSRSLEQQLAEEAATVDQWRVLRSLAAFDGSLMGELSRRLHIPGPSVTRVVDGLVDRALAYRRHTVEDRRRVAVHISEAGRASLARMDAIVHAHEQRIRQALGQQGFTTLVTSIEELCGLERDAVLSDLSGTGSATTNYFHLDH